MRRLTVFGQELAGTLRRASVVDALLRHIREAFAPSEIAVSLYHRDVDALASVHEWPGGGPDRRALLDLAARRGPRCSSPTASIRWCTRGPSRRSRGPGAAG